MTKRPTVGPAETRPLDQLPPDAPLAEVEAAVRRLVSEVASLDPLAREIRREWARRELVRIRYYAPARLLAAALGPAPVDVGQLLSDLALYFQRTAAGLEDRSGAPAPRQPQGAAPGR